MKFSIIKIITIVFALLAFFACDNVEKPYLEDNGGKCGNGDLSIPIKKILLEDYTGHTCGNCPRAAEQTELLIEAYCDHIIPISVHVGFFAEPYPSGKYTYDFRTPTGNEWNDFFGNGSVGLPNGMVNRIEYNGTEILAYETWVSAIEQILSEAPTIDINIENNYSENTRELNISLNIDFLKSISENLNLSLVIVEDSIINWQKDYDYEDINNPGNTNIENYIHRHVLRDAINGTWGEAMKKNIQQGETIKKSFKYILNSEWSAKHCSIVAFAYSTKTKEIIQAEIKKVD